MYTIDINCDLGEGAGHDKEIMPYISSANIACGCHAGDENVIRQTIEWALQYNVAIGAHPGFNDKANFGRTEMYLDDYALYTLVLEQVGLVKKIAAEYNTTLHHVKPHGAMYNMAAKDVAMANIIAKAVHDADPSLVLYGLHNSYLVSAAKDNNLRTANEFFADRRYTDSGNLVSRSANNALIENDDEAVAQVLNMVKNGTVLSTDWKVIQVQAETVCIHGDGKHAVVFAKKIHEALISHNIAVKTI